MSDEQLIRLLREKLPEEFTGDEIALVRRRLPHSSELRQAVADHLELEQALYHARGGVRLSVDDLVRRALLAPATRGASKFFGWETAAAVLFTLAALGAVIYGRRDRRPVEVAQANSAASAPRIAKRAAGPSVPKRNEPRRHVVRKPPIRTAKLSAPQRAVPPAGSSGDKADSSAALDAPSTADPDVVAIVTPAGDASETIAADRSAEVPMPANSAGLAWHVELDNEARRASAELAAALEHRAWRDACRVIVAGAADHGDGLTPDDANGRFCSFNRMAFEAMRQHAGLRQAMCDDYAVNAWRGYRRAADREDAVAMTAVAGQFLGTSAATAARQWLGDRALAAGRFRLALGNYLAAAKLVSDQQRGGLLARIRLCGALLGRELGEPVTETIELEGEQLSPVEFERLVAEMRTRAAANPTATEIAALTATAAEIQKALSQSVAGDLLITITNEQGHLATARKQRTGEVVWRKQLDGMSLAAPAIVDDQLFVCLAVPDAGGGRRVNLSALAAQTGEIVARRPLARLPAKESAEMTARIEAADSSLLVTIGDLMFHTDLEGRPYCVRQIAEDSQASLPE